ncbi:MAG: excinuclease ABC subunit UvrC [Candidatus Omnitrophica bacterium]|nr:excinuclease ABC subunit UvrC [Candidatus Omnitrophota bacterium]
MAEIKIQELINKLPLSSGVYIFKAQTGSVLYVGKAISIRSRVRNHFSSQSAKKDLFLSLVEEIDYITCESEEQALILEAALIKEKKPKYNIALRDDKSYPYIEITQEAFPRVKITRTDKISGKELIGPYPKVKVLKASLSLIREVFPFCSCLKRPKRPCLYYHIKLCPGPCVAGLSKDSYQENILNIKKIFKGQRQQLIRDLKNKMNKLSREMKFEEAALLRDKLVAIENLYNGKKSVHFLMALKRKLNLKSLPLHVEAIDISCLAGDFATGSVVVFRDGLSDKSAYRRYKIKTVKGIDDYAMVSEIVRRRYSRLSREKNSFPDLLIIDGGLGQLTAACQELEKLGLKVPVISIAKKNEELWLPQKSKPLVLSKSSPELQFVQRVRDEAHRFAKSYHKLLRAKQYIKD